MTYACHLHTDQQIKPFLIDSQPEEYPYYVSIKILVNLNFTFFVKKRFLYIRKECTQYMKNIRNFLTSMTSFPACLGARISPAATENIYAMP